MHFALHAVGRCFHGPLRRHWLHPVSFTELCAPQVTHCSWKPHVKSPALYTQHAVRWCAVPDGAYMVSSSQLPRVPMTSSSLALARSRSAAPHRPSFAPTPHPTLLCSALPRSNKPLSQNRATTSIYPSTQTKDHTRVIRWDVLIMAYPTTHCPITRVRARTHWEATTHQHTDQTGGGGGARAASFVSLTYNGHQATHKGARGSIQPLTEPRRWRLHGARACTTRCGRSCEKRGAPPRFPTELRARSAYRRVTQDAKLLRAQEHRTP